MHPHTRHDSEEICDVACTLCGCVCDDLTFAVSNNRICHVENACSKALQWYNQLEPQDELACQVNGETVSLDFAIDQAVELLGGSRWPLIYGLSSSSTEGQQVAVEIGDRLGGIVDTSASTCHAPSIMAFQVVGESTSSLGEVKGRADLVIYWGSNPVESHPRHIDRYTPSNNSPDNDRKCTMVTIDCSESETSRVSDEFVQIHPGCDFEVLWALRAIVRGHAIDDEAIGGVPTSQLRALAKE